MIDMFSSQLRQSNNNRLAHCLPLHMDHVTMGAMPDRAAALIVINVIPYCNNAAIEMRTSHDRH